MQEQLVLFDQKSIARSMHTKASVKLTYTEVASKDRVRWLNGENISIQVVNCIIYMRANRIECSST